MSIDRSESMRPMNDDPEFAAARDQAARERILAERDRMQRLANIARRGVDVPDHLDARWRELKQMKIPNRDAATVLGLRWLGDTEDADETRWARHRSLQIVEEVIDLVEESKTIDPDEAFELVERLKNVQRILSWNDPEQKEAQ